MTPPPAPAARPASTVAELQSLIQNRQVSELRTTYNGTYGASLLFKPDDLTYYVALFQQKDFWRVVKTQSDKQAEATYRAFAGQSWNWPRSISSASACRRSTPTTKLLASRNAQLSTLQADNTLRMRQEEQSPPASNNRARKPPPWPTSRRTCASNCAICSARSDALQARRPSSAARARRQARQISARLRVRHAIWRAVWARFLVSAG